MLDILVVFLPLIGSVIAGIIVFVLFVFSLFIVSVDVVAVVVGKCGGAQEKMA